MKNSLKVLILLTILFTSAFTPYKNNPGKIVVVIDAGHGGFDTGAVQNIHKEKDLTLEIAQRIKKQNKNANVEIILTREDDQDLDLNARSKKINEIKPQFFISLHTNKSNMKELKGTEVYHAPSKVEAKELAEKFFASIDDSLEKRGVKSGNFHLLRESDVPGFIYEIGFISNDEDYDFITSEAGKQKIVNEILTFIQK